MKSSDSNSFEQYEFEQYKAEMLRLWKKLGQENTKLRDFEANYLQALMDDADPKCENIMIAVFLVKHKDWLPHVAYGVKNGLRLTLEIGLLESGYLGDDVTLEAIKKQILLCLKSTDFYMKINHAKLEKDINNNIKSSGKFSFDLALTDLNKDMLFFSRKNAAQPTDETYEIETLFLGQNTGSLKLNKDNCSEIVELLISHFKKLEADVRQGKCSELCENEFKKLKHTYLALAHPIKRLSGQGVNNKSLITAFQECSNALQSKLLDERSKIAPLQQVQLSN